MIYHICPVYYSSRESRVVYNDKSLSSPNGSNQNGRGRAPVAARAVRLPSQTGSIGAVGSQQDLAYGGAFRVKVPSELKPKAIDVRAASELVGLTALQANGVGFCEVDRAVKQSSLTSDCSRALHLGLLRLWRGLRKHLRHLSQLG